MIPRRFIRIWLGPAPIPDLFESWWCAFQDLHPGYDFVTLTDANPIPIPASLQDLYASVPTYAGRADILRILALHQLGGVYIDTDIMPLKSFEPLLSDPRPFIGRRSSRSFESAVIGSPAQHPSLQDLIDALPAWAKAHSDNAASVQTGPAFISSVWFGRPDIRHLPAKTFYPYNGFGAPKRDAKLALFEAKDFPPEMLAAHFSNHRWGGKPK